jgi:hypothetical protein
MDIKQSKRQNATKLARCVGVSILMSHIPQIHAQSTVDNLLNKLEQKGILTVDETKQLKLESTENDTNDFATALNSRFPMPDWVTSYQVGGDFRGRVDERDSDNSTFVNRTLFRYRLRVGLVVNMKDNLQVGFRLGSGDPGGGFATGNPISDNSTLQDNGSKKPLWIDTAYGRWTPINDGTWMLRGTFGKMDQPFQASPMMFDPNYTPEGGAVNAAYKINNANGLLLNTAAFVLDEESASSRDPFLYGGQLIWRAIWTSKVASALGVAAFDIVNPEMLTTANVPNINQGNTRTAGGALVYAYNPIFVDGSVTYKLDSFPLYPVAFPIKLSGEYLNNPGAPSNNEGFWGGIMFGQAGRKHTWDISYRYEYLEGDAWYDDFVNVDNMAYYPVAPVGASAGLYSGTNVKGHLIQLDYSLTDSLSFTFFCYINNLINNPGVTSSEAVHAMADIMWKF